jgi:selenocysteine lyase/cysteine desulfurase
VTPGVDNASETAAYAAFLQTHPDYASTAGLDRLRAVEYARIDGQGDIYLDYTGGGLFADSQVRQHIELLAAQIFGNPHSGSPSSAATTSLVERARSRVLRYFNAPANEYTAVFTPNATGALKLVGEAYPFAPGSRLLLTFDNHNSVNGIREFAAARGADHVYAPLTVPDLRIDLERLDGLLSAANPRAANLFAYPAQSNFSGVKHPLDLIERAQARGWDVLLDAAAFVPTNRLDLTAIKPDFVAISFYKMFGYPTGVGLLLLRKPAASKLNRPWFAGGTVNFSTVQGRIHILSPGEAGLEDGTLNYLSIPAVEIGLEHLERTGIDQIQRRVACLTDWLIAELLTLAHSNGRHMVRIYGPTTMVMRGGTVTMNFYDPDGHLIDYRRVEELAGARRISLRTGCFCNPGAGETAEALTEADILASLAEDSDMTLPRFLQVIHRRSGKSEGAIRVSLGVISNFADVYRFVQFARGFRDQTQLAIGDVTGDIDSCRIIRDGT